MKSLVVEDEFVGRLLLQKTLEKLGECHTAENGDDALAAFSRSLEERARYDLVCLDVLMPGMSGPEVLQGIRELERRADIHPRDGVKVIMITALRDSETVESSFDAQCDHYLTKPYRVETLLEMIAAMGLAK